MKEKLAASVILYNPQPSTWENIQTYLPFVDRLYILDNSSQSHENELFTAINDSNKIEYISQNENLGISIQLNIACKKAIADGYDWLLTMDQDSFFEKNDLEEYLKITQSNSLNKIGVWGINYEDKTPSKSRVEIVPVDYTITSGSLINLTCYIQTEGFDENLFIDSVDVDYCFQVINKKWKVLQVKNIHLNHQLGIKTKSVLLKNERVLHNPTRIYYMIRNYFYLKKKYKNQFQPYFRILKNDLLIRIKNNFILGNNKIKTVNSIFKGYVDYKKKNMGKN
jgi:rhamnosyltransferase